MSDESMRRHGAPASASKRSTGSLKKAEASRGEMCGRWGGRDAPWALFTIVLYHSRGTFLDFWRLVREHH